MPTEAAEDGKRELRAARIVDYGKPKDQKPPKMGQVHQVVPVPPKIEPCTDGETSKSPTSASGSSRTIPDVLYAEDGQVFYPCKHCCRAFANQPDLNRHSAICAGGRSTPNPFLKHVGSMRNGGAREVNDDNNNGSQNRVLGGKVKRRTLSNVKASLMADCVKGGQSKRRRGRPKGTTRVAMMARRKAVKVADSDPNCQKNVITIDSVAENINNLPPDTKAAVLENINRLLKDSSISVLAPKDSGPIIVETAASHSIPALQLTSRNINSTSVEIKTIKKGGVPKGPTEKLPDIAEILEMNFGISKPVYRPEYYPPSPEPMDVPETSKPIKQPPKEQDAVVGEAETEEVAVEEPEFEGTIVLEDLDIHICKQCGSVYHTLEDLVIHDKYEHRNIKKRYPPTELDKFNAVFKSANNTTCPICGRVLSAKTAWPRHLLTHSIQLNFECRICRKKFTRNDHRKLHEKRHVHHSADDE